nr:RNA chaperone Hfq [Cupriavidus sp. AU9028]
MQDRQFAFHRASRHPVVVYLTNGDTLTGMVVGADTYMVFLKLAEEDAAPTVVYKHAIAAICSASADGDDGSLPDDEALAAARQLFTPRGPARRKR